MEKRPALLNAYIDGAHCDQIEMEFPICPPGSLQCTVGGFSGLMAQFNFFSEPLTPKVLNFDCCVWYLGLSHLTL